MLQAKCRLRAYRQPRPESEVSSSSVNPRALRKLLDGYDSSLASYLVAGFTSGFRLGCSTIPPLDGSIPKNHRSACERPDVVSKKIAKELKLGRIMGPFDEPSN